MAHITEIQVFFSLHTRSLVAILKNNARIAKTTALCESYFLTSPRTLTKHGFLYSPRIAEPFWQALKPSGSLVINIKDKVVNGVRHRYVWKTLEKLAQLGWLCLDDYIWHKRNAMPGRWPNRLRDGWEYVFHLAKTTRPYFNVDAVRIPTSTTTKLKYQQAKAKPDKRVYSANGSGFSKNLASWNIQDTALPANVLHLAAEEIGAILRYFR